MGTLTGEMKEEFAKSKPFAIATASSMGIPHVVPMSRVQIVADDTIWIGAPAWSGRLQMLRKILKWHCMFGILKRSHCFQIKGTVTVKTSGPEYEKIKARIQAKGPNYPAKGLLILKVSELFNCTPGADAGKLG